MNNVYDIAQQYVNNIGTVYTLETESMRFSLRQSELLGKLRAKGHYIQTIGGQYFLVMAMDPTSKDLIIITKA